MASTLFLALWILFSPCKHQLVSAIFTEILTQWITVIFVSTRHCFRFIFLIFLLSAFLTGAPLSINHSYWGFCIFKRFEILPANDFRQFYPFWETFHPRPEACIKDHWIHLILVYSGPFSRLYCIFCTVATIVYIWPTFVYFCPLSMFWSWWIPIVCPYRFSSVASSRPCRHQSSEPRRRTRQSFCPLPGV